MSVLGDDLAGVLDGPRINLWMTLLEEIFDKMLRSISQHIYEPLSLSYTYILGESEFKLWVNRYSATCVMEST